MNLDEYSMNFTKELYDIFPEFQNYQEIKQYDNSNEGYLLIEVPSPFNKDNTLWISTHSDEITIGFDWYHTHFGYGETDEDDYISAIKLIKEIIEEEIAIAIIKKEDEWVRSLIISDKKMPKINKDETIEIKSWNGKYFS